jgi:hypothetical protein
VSLHSCELFVQSVDSTSRNNIIDAGKYVVLFYVQDNRYKLSAMKEPDEKDNLETYIVSEPIEGKKEEDWYRVDNADKCDEIIDYVSGNDVKGVTYNLTWEAPN